MMAYIRDDIYRRFWVFMSICYGALIVLGYFYLVDKAQSQFFTMVNGSSAEEFWEWMIFLSALTGLGAIIGPWRRKPMAMQIEAMGAGLLALMQIFYIWTQIVVRWNPPPHVPDNPMPWHTVLGLTALASLLVGRSWFLVEARRDVLLRQKTFSKLKKEEGL